MLHSPKDLLQGQGKDGFWKPLDAITAGSEGRNLGCGRFFGRFRRLVYKLARQIQSFTNLMLKQKGYIQALLQQLKQLVWFKAAAAIFYPAL